MDNKLNEQPADILNKFVWTREWFANVEGVLLTLDYHGESYRQIIEFIRTKIRETDIITFNQTFIKINGLEHIPNLYELVLENSDYASRILLNKNKKIVDAVLKYYINIDECSIYDLNECVSDRAVSYLLENPHLIIWSTFKQNSNIRAVKHCIANGAINGNLLSGIDDDEVIEYLINNPEHIDWYRFCKNPNSRAVEYLLKNLHIVNQNYLSLNPNDKIVDYLLEDKSRLYYGLLSRNTNNRIVDHLLQNPEKIIYGHFARNKTNHKVAEYVLKHSSVLNLEYLSKHSSDLIIDHLLQNPEKIHWIKLSINNNDRAAEHCIRFGTRDKFLVCIIALFHNCEYNMQKFRAFNEARLFDKIQI